MRWKAARLRKKRNFWKRRGHAHLVANQGIWLRDGLYPEFVGIGLMASGEMQPNFYRKYP